MSKCFIEGMGGGIGKLFAVIGVTYPAGSTLTCTNGTKTLTAKTTSGQWVFAIPEAGTWTVTATDGAKGKSKTVEITTEGQSEKVALDYTLYLFTEGQGLASGYTVTRTRGMDSFTITESYIGATHKNTGAMFYFEPQINLAAYNTLKADISCSERYDSSYQVHIGVGSNATSNNDDYPSDDKARVSYYSTARSTVSVDVSNLNELCYVKVHGASIVFNIYNIWLE